MHHPMLDKKDASNSLETVLKFPEFTEYLPCEITRVVNLINELNQVQSDQLSKVQSKCKLIQKNELSDSSLAKEFKDARCLFNMVHSTGIIAYNKSKRLTNLLQNTLCAINSKILEYEKKHESNKSKEKIELPDGYKFEYYNDLSLDSEASKETPLSMLEQVNDLKTKVLSSLHSSGEITTLDNKLFIHPEITHEENKKIEENIPETKDEKKNTCKENIISIKLNLKRPNNNIINDNVKPSNEKKIKLSLETRSKKSASIKDSEDIKSNNSITSNKKDKIKNKKKRKIKNKKSSDDETLYCICNDVSYGEMIACENTSCEKEWFHLDCVGLKSVPKSKWYCNECSILMKSNAKK